MLRSKEKTYFYKKNLLFFKFILLIFVIYFPSSASPSQNSSNISSLVPASLLKWPEQGSEYAVLVDKSAQKIFLYHRDNPFLPEKTYICSTGERDGAKTKKNDRKTQRS